MRKIAIPSKKLKPMSKEGDESGRRAWLVKIEQVDTVHVRGRDITVIESVWANIALEPGDIEIIAAGHPSEQLVWIARAIVVRLCILLPEGPLWGFKAMAGSVGQP